MKGFLRTRLSIFSLALVMTLTGFTGRHKLMQYHRADHPAFQYCGRIDFSDSKAPLFSYPGVSIKVRFQGSALDVVIKDYAAGGSKQTNYFNIFIDGVLHTVLEVNATDTLYSVSRSLSDTEHTLEIFKRTESLVGESSFLGIRILSTKQLLPPPPLPERKIEFIGDSYNAGYGNEVSIPAPPNGNPRTGFHSVNENNYTSWCALVSRNLNAQSHCTAYSGYGMYRDYDGNTMYTLPNIYGRTLPDKPSSVWNPAAYVPDVVIIMLGGNDMGPEDSPKPDMLDSTAFVDTYIKFVSQLRSYYPSASIFCITTNGVINEYPENLNERTRMINYTKAVYNYYAVQGDAKVYYIEMSPLNGAPYGEQWHPSNSRHKMMADFITPVIKNKMNW